MPTIDELKEMDFVNWDAAAPGTGFDLPVTSEGAPVSSEALPTTSGEPNMGLVFGDVDGDDWSYWALEHFDASQVLQVPQDVNVSAKPGLEDTPASAAGLFWETPEAPCNHCALGGYQCKRIEEGNYRGYCTSCVALQRECSLVPSTSNNSNNNSHNNNDIITAGTGATFPPNTWATSGDRPEASILFEDEFAAIPTAPPAAAIPTPAGNEQSPLQPPSMPKIGARFSRESVKVLKNWLNTHRRHPYPTDEEKEGLQKITGLNKTQITNWLANARRRGKIQPTRATSPHIGRGYAVAMDIPQRRGTAGSFETMNPLQRWANSPPENEPASVSAIARAVSDSNSYSGTSGSGRTSPYVSNYSDDGSSRSLCNQSSASSLGTSHSSGGSFASAYSNQSRGSFGSLPSFARSSRGRRRRRRAPPPRAEEALAQPLKTFQCTFCTETFRTKHDWQRHEKSLHLSLERWVCSPDGPRVIGGENGVMSCVFCGALNPDDAHVESHDFSACTERPIEDRTFYRKDHLRQHLKLVHDVKFLPWAMDKWRVASPQIRSRCGFCNVVLDSWKFRVDHIAEHFKTGKTMADWKGDWGFEAPVLEMVENSIPPYLIDNERKSPDPYTGGSPVATPNNAYELLKMEIQHFIAQRTESTHFTPTDAEIQQHACHIIFNADALTRKATGPTTSWLRDLVMSSEEATKQAMFQSPKETSWLSSLRVNGKANIFEDCEFETQLQEYVHSRLSLGLTAMDHELQPEACQILGRAEETSGNPSDVFANWLVRLINSSTAWLENFRRRAHLPRSEDMGDYNQRSKDPRTIDSTIHVFGRLETDLAQYLQSQRALGLEPTDADLQRQSRIIIYELDDEWNQTAADDKGWLDGFRQRNPPQEATTTAMRSNGSPTALEPPSSALPTTSALPAATASGSAALADCRYNSDFWFLADSNCYRRLERDLSRFVASTTSANNPNCHVPSDEELQHQARWIVYDDDDPWNQTAADNAEWLRRFKQDVGILPRSADPLLPPAPITTTTATTTAAAAALHPPQPALLPRDLEAGLRAYAERELRHAGGFPGDAALRERARQIMGMQRTPLDADAAAPRRFRESLGARAGGAAAAGARLDLAPSSVALPHPAVSGITAAASSAFGVVDPDPLAGLPSADLLPPDVDMAGGGDGDFHFTEQELRDLLQDADVDVGAGGFGGSPSARGMMF
ncbi:hypothetical protein F4780DRAFT_756340 [Xylariomycetidae sp. FL0641]|nr:hypothetical protein F4780DRAFT_756340 [Xylariomycetidae sp. FL0641]